MPQSTDTGELRTGIEPVSLGYKASAGPLSCTGAGDWVKARRTDHSKTKPEGSHRLASESGNARPVRPPSGSSEPVRWASRTRTCVGRGQNPAGQPSDHRPLPCTVVRWARRVRTSKNLPVSGFRNRRVCQFPYRPMAFRTPSLVADSNRRPPSYQEGALPTELTGHGPARTCTQTARHRAVCPFPGARAAVRSRTELDRLRGGRSTYMSYGGATQPGRPPAGVSQSNHAPLCRC